MEGQNLVHFTIALARLIVATLAKDHGGLRLIGLRMCEQMKECPNFKNSSRDLLCGLITGKTTDQASEITAKDDYVKKSNEKSMQTGQDCFSFFQEGDVKTSCPKKIGMDCSAKSECSMQNSEDCIEGSCKCSVGYSILPVNGSCVKQFGMKCSAKTECSMQNFDCIKDSCQCAVGYSFLPSNGSCVKHCREYGDGYTVYPKYGIKGFNNAFAAAKSMEECMNACLKKRKFVCISVEFKKGSFINQCILSKKAWFDVPEENRVADGHGWLYIQRHCAF